MDAYSYMTVSRWDGLLVLVVVAAFVLIVSWYLFGRENEELIE